MMKSEFNDILLEVSPTHRLPNDTQYQKIETVYTYHPAISDKENIVRLWSDFGDVIIEDMLPRALKIMEAEKIMNEKYTEYMDARKNYIALTLIESED